MTMNLVIYVLIFQTAFFASIMISLSHRIERLNRRIRELESKNGRTVNRLGDVYRRFRHTYGIDPNKPITSQEIELFLEWMKGAMNEVRNDKKM